MRGRGSAIFGVTVLLPVFAAALLARFDMAMISALIAGYGEAAAWSVLVIGGAYIGGRKRRRRMRPPEASS